MFNSSYLLNKNLDVRLGGVNKLITFPMLFSPKTAYGSGKVYSNPLENPNYCKVIRTVNDTLGDIYDGVETFEEISPSAYKKIVVDSGDFIELFSGPMYVYTTFKMSLKEEAIRNGALTTSSTTQDLINRFYDFKFDITARGESPNGGVNASGINLYAFNFITNKWDIVKTNTASLVSESGAKMSVTITAKNIDTYLNKDDGCVYFALRPFYPGNSQANSKIIVSYCRCEATIYSNIIPVYTKSLGNNKHVSIETTASEIEQAIDFNVEFINVIINDGVEDIYFNFDNPINNGNYITLKPTESLSDFPLNCRLLYCKSKSGLQSFRAWGVK